MEEPEVRKPQAWLPLTPGGVAAFSFAKIGRVMLVQCLVAILAAGTVIWSLQAAWFPALESAIGNLPDAGDIRVGLLDWQGPETATLVETHFLAFTVNLSGHDQPRTTSHVQVELRPRSFRIDSLLGATEQVYPGRGITPLNRPELQPWWAAWRLPILILVALGVFTFLFAAWFVLATVYCLPVRLAAFFSNRNLTLVGSWKLCSAALLPAALFLCAGLLAYAAGAIDLMKLALVFGMHFVLGWLFIGAGVCALKSGSHSDSTGTNPFREPAA